jgi:hypothetical protein
MESYEIQSGKVLQKAIPAKLKFPGRHFRHLVTGTVVKRLPAGQSGRVARLLYDLYVGAGNSSKHNQKLFDRSQHPTSREVSLFF